MKIYKFFKIFLMVLIMHLIILGISLYYYTNLNAYTNNNNNNLISENSDKISLASSEETLFDGVLNLIAEKGAGIIKDNLPTVGDYLCAQIFDSFEIDYTDSYTKELTNVNKKLDEIEENLKEIIENQEKQVSQNTMIDFFNAVDVFSQTVYPIYAGYNNMIISEKEEIYSAEKAREQQQLFYENNLQSILFGSSTSTGDLYLQLINLLNKVIIPNRTVESVTLLEHYHITYAYLWAFESQTYVPKKEFLGYVSTTILEGLVLYSFQNAYEIRKAEEAGNEVQKVIYKERWKQIKSYSDKALKYLQDEINNINKEEQESFENDTTLHYSTGTIVSRTLYSGKVRSGSDRYYSYASSTYADRQKSKIIVKYVTLNNEKFIKQVQNEYLAHLKNYKKDSKYTIVDFLKDAGFSCDNWDCIGLYMSQSYKHEGSTFTTEYFNFYANHVNLYGKTINQQWVILKYEVLSVPKPTYYDYEKQNYLAFVGVDGYLIGSFEQIYSDSGSGNKVVDKIYSALDVNRVYRDDSTKGKVR